MSRLLPTFLLQAAGADGERFLPHGYCFLWNRPLLWTHVASDVLIGLAYVTISFSLAWLVHRARREIPFSAAFVMFGLFIVTCGLTHFLEVVTFWNPIYPTLGAVKVVTAAASITTAIAMPTLAPRVVDTARTARTARERELAAARAEARSTTLQEANAELAALNASLREALAAAEEARRDAEHARGEAERARADAVEANRAKSMFLTTMSHELRTPLNAIGGHVALVELGVHGAVTDAQRTALGRVQAAQRHLLGLINDVLNFARLEAGRVEYRIADVALGAVIAETAALLEVQRVGRAQALALELPPADVRVRADEDKLRQVLVNVLGNAIKFTPDGGRLGIAVLAPTGETEDVLVTISDTGIGIPAERLEAIFDPFVQLHGTDAALPPALRGTGLGLAISRELARAMGGDLTVTSEVGRGSVFALRLPRAA